MRMIVADDSVLLREGLARLLEDAGHEVVAKVGDAGALLDAVAVHRPEIAVVDVRMPPSPFKGSDAVPRRSPSVARGTRPMGHPPSRARKCRPASGR